jgi:copper(I)-binding protein
MRIDCVCVASIFNQGSSMKLQMIATILAVAAGAVSAQTVEVKDAWVRPSVAGQTATGAFMTLTAKDGARLMSIASPVSGVVEVHEMKMDGDVMRMRAVQGGLVLPAGEAVQLKPGAYHAMLMDLKQPLLKGSTIPMTLVFKNAKGQESKIALTVPVAMTPPAGGAPMTMPAGAHSH